MLTYGNYHCLIHWAVWWDQAWWHSQKYPPLPPQALFGEKWRLSTWKIAFNFRARTQLYTEIDNQIIVK